MITRAQIRRQLRKEGGVMNAVPRQKYGIGSFIRKLIPKELAKVSSVAAPFVAPFNPALAAGMAGLGSFQQQGNLGRALKAAALNYGGGQAARYLGGAGFQGNPFTQGGAFRGGLEGFKGGFSSPLSAERGASLFGTPGSWSGAGIGPAGQYGGGTFTEATKGILGKLGLTKGGGSMKMTPFGMISGVSLLTYFMQKGKTEDEATQLAQDVFRGKGLGLDLIKADVAKYRSGALSGSQMFDKGYHFLTPRDYIGAKGGRVKYGQGSGEGVKQMYISDEAGALPKSEGGVLPEDVGKLSVDDFDDIEDYRRYIKYLKKTKKASGGRIGLFKGTDPEDDRDIMEIMRDEYGTWDQHDADYYSKLKKKKPEEGIKSLEAGALPIKVEGDVRPENMKMAAYRPGKLINVDKMPRKKLVGHLNSMELPETNARDFDDNHIRQILIDFAPDIFTGSWGSNMAQGGRIGKFGGGMGITMPSIPTGMPRINTGGIRELDYRQSGGFVPVGVKEKADDVPAMLSKNEFVMTADAVKAAGGGSVEKGAQRMYDTMKRLEGKVV